MCGVRVAYERENKMCIAMCEFDMNRLHVPNAMCPRTFWGNPNDSQGEVNTVNPLFAAPGGLSGR